MTITLHTTKMMICRSFFTVAIIFTPIMTEIMAMGMITMALIEETGIDL